MSHDNAPKPLFCITMNKTFPSVVSASKALGVSGQRIKYVLAGVAQSIKGHRFEWYDPNKHPAPTYE